MSGRSFVIAEAGVNHNGSLELALELVDVAAAAGADAVKFQSFKAERLLTRTAAKADYQLRTTDAGESQFEMIRRLELSDEMHRAILARCREKDIVFLSTPFDVESLAYLTEELGLERIKLPSGEITNGPLLLAAARRAESIILSTGMATLGEVETALAVLVWGRVRGEEDPSGESAVRDCYAEHGTAPLAGHLVLLHCTTEYPAAFEDTNLRAMDSLRQAFGLEVGFSDHTPGIAVPLAAVARGAVVIEKHFTLDRGLPGPDHEASLEPHELREMIAGIRAVEAALGDGLKRPAASEMSNRAVVRKSLVASRPIAAGEPFAPDNLAVKRPGTGLSPMRYWDLLGRPAGQAYDADDPI